MSEKELEEQKRNESKKFLKVYMLTLIVVVLVLISMSYFAQNKLNVQIETLSKRVNSTEQEAKTHMTNAENLQMLTKKQEDLIKMQEQEIAELKEQNENLNNENDANSKTIYGITKFLQLETLYNDKEYEQCAVLVEEINNDGYISQLEIYNEFAKIVDDLIEKGYIIK